ncbi:MAG: YhfC family intramembrane metalloprotease, partial [Oscillospiraceae bacterium]
MVSSTVITVLVIMVVIGFAAPLAVGIVWKIKTKQPVTTMLIGAGTFFVFAIILETLPKLVLFQTNNPVGQYVMSNPMLMMVIAAALAGIFEETGRLAAYKLLLKKHRERLTAISYGIGHGGFEVMYLLGIASTQYIAYAVMINSGEFDAILAQVAAAAPEQAAALEAIPQALSAVGWSSLVLALMERVSAMCLHISCSILMFKAVNVKGKMWLYPVAVLLHAGVDMFAALYQGGVITNLYVLEICLLVCS